MTTTLVLVHTVSPLVGVFDRLAAELLPGVKVKHILDEPILDSVRQHGGLASEVTDRLRSHVAMATSIGAQAVLVTCSTISPLVDRVRPSAAIPVFKIDEAMIEQAVQVGTRIGVVATNPTTLEPTRQLLQEQSSKMGRDILVEMTLVPGALDALLRGDGDRHDALVRQAVLEISPRVDGVVLAQATMARVLACLPEAERRVPVFSSPHLALAQVKRFLDGIQ